MHQNPYKGKKGSFSRPRSPEITKVFVFNMIGTCIGLRLNIPANIYSKLTL